MTSSSSISSAPQTRTQLIGRLLSGKESGGTRPAGPPQGWTGRLLGRNGRDVVGLGRRLLARRQLALHPVVRLAQLAEDGREDLLVRGPGARIGLRAVVLD